MNFKEMKTYPTLVECGFCHKQDTINIPLMGYATKEDSRGWSQLMPCFASITLCPECGVKWDKDHEHILKGVKK
jgi:hypothetical protein